jgi:predicted lipid-binding transport protein (Tim44 family)
MGVCVRVARVARVARNRGGAAVPRERGARERARTSAKRESTGMEQGVAIAASAKYERWVRAAKKKEEKKLRNLRQTHVLERVIRRSRIFNRKTAAR